MKLTPRQTQVVKLVCDGLPHKTVAAKLGVSEGIISYHVTNIYKRLGLNCIAQLVKWAIREGVTNL